MISQHSWTKTWLSICQSISGHHSRKESQNWKKMSGLVKSLPTISAARWSWTLTTTKQKTLRRVLDSQLTNDSRVMTSHYLQSRASLLADQQRRRAPRRTIQQLRPTPSSWLHPSLHTTSTRRSRPTLISMSSSTVNSRLSSQFCSKRASVSSSLSII